MEPFVSKLLGMGDLSGLMEKVADLNLQDKEDMMKRIVAGKCAYIICLHHCSNLKINKLIVIYFPLSIQSFFSSSSEKECKQKHIMCQKST